MTVTTPPTLSSSLTGSVCNNNLFTYTATSATGGTTFSWTRAAVTNITPTTGNGANANVSETLVNATANPIDVTYTFTLSHSGCVVTQDVTVTVNPTLVPSVLIGSDHSNPICNGTSVTFTATPTNGGASPVYQWYLNNTTPVGTNSATYITTTLTTGDFVTVQLTSNALCAVPTVVYSNSFTASIIFPPSISVQPTSSGICTNNNTSFSVSASGDALTYQWQEDQGGGFANLSDAGVYSGSTTNTLSITGATTGMNGYHYRVVISGTCSPTATSNGLAMLSVTDPPTLSSSSTVATCDNTVFHYTPTSATPGTTFVWSRNTVVGISNTAASGNNDPAETLHNTTSNPIDVTYTYTLSANGCTNPTTFNVTVTVNPSPNVTTSTTASTCSGTSPNISLTADISSTFAWILGTNTGGITGASASNGSAINQVLTNPSNATAGSIVYHVIPTSTGGLCAGPATDITVTVNPTPAVTNSNTASTCNNTSPNIGLTASALSTFAWTLGTNTGGITGASAGSGSSINQVLGNPSNSTAGSIVYHVTPTSTTGLCVGAAYDITVTVNPTPAITNSNTASTCNNTSPNIGLTASAPSTFTWTVGAITGGITGANAGSGSTISDVLTNPSNATAGTVVYTITPTSTTGLCVGTPFNITVTVKPTPAFTSATTAAVCSNTPFSYTATSSIGGSSFSWTRASVTNITPATGNGANANVSETLVNSTLSPIDVTYTFTFSSNGCSNTQDVTVTVNPTLVPSVLIGSDHSNPICNGTAVTFTATPTNGGAAPAYQWYLNNTTPVGTNSATYITTTLTTGDFVTVQLTSNALCAVPTVVYSNSFTASIIFPPSISVQPASSGICTGNNTSFSVSASGDALTYQWQEDQGGGFANLSDAGVYSGSTTSTLSITGATTGMNGYHYRVVISGTCAPTATSNGLAMLSVTDPPTLSSSTTAATCDNTVFHYTPTSATPATTFAWSRNTVVGISNGAASGNNDPAETLHNTTSNPIDVTYTYTLSANGCTNPTTFDVTVTVNPSPNVTTSTSASTCSGTSPNISLTADISSTFAWTLGANTGGIAGASASNGSAINQVLTNPSNSTAGSIVYHVIPTSTGGLCAGPATDITVTVNPTPAVTNSNTASTCNNTSPNISLTASAPSTFTWSVGAITGGITGANAGSGSTISDVLINPSNATAGTVVYTITPTSTTGLCAGAPFNITVTVNPTPAVTNSNTASTCNNTSPNIGLTASAPSTFTWTVGAITGGITGANAGSGATISDVLTNPSNATAGTVVYTITPTSTTGLCVGAPFNITVTVNPTPAVTNSNTASTCNNTSPNIGLTASTPSTFTWTLGTNTGGITGASAGSGSSINQVLSNPSNSTAGSIVYHVTPTSTTGLCVGAAYDITVTVNPTPAVTNSNTASTCNNTSPNIGLTASAPSTFTWTVGTITGGITGANAGSGATIGDVLTNPSNATAGTVVYTVTPTSTTGLCVGAPYNITVTVNPTPAVTNSNTASTCNNTSPNIGLTASAPSSFTWTVGTITGGITGANAGSVNTIGDVLTNPSNATAGTVVYTVTPTSTTGLCAGAPYNITVTVNPTPAVTNSNTASTCNNTSPNIGLTASAPSTFTWTLGTNTGGITGASAGSGSSINQVLSNPSNSTAGSIVYHVTPTSTTGLCVGAAYDITVTVNPTPAVTNSNTASTCNNTSPNISLTASAPSTFTWTLGTNTGGITGASAGSGSSINQVLGNPSNATAGSIVYHVTPTSTTGLCVGAAYDITVTVNPTPAVTNSNTASTCNNTSPNIGLTASTPSTFTWTLGANTGGITGASAGSGSSINQVLGNPSNSTAGSIVYHVTPTSTTGLCAGAAYDITVTVNPTPAVTNSNTASTCNNTSPNISLIASAPSTFSWTVGSITGGITGANAGSGSTISDVLTNPSNATAGTVVYTVTPTSTTGLCIGAPYNITVTVNPTPAVTNSNTASTCNNTSPNIGLTASAPSTFTWTLGTNTGGITGASAGSGPSINQVLGNPSNSTAGSIVYHVTPTSTTGLCVGAPYDITVTVNPTPAVTNTTNVNTCSNTSPNINLSATAASTFTWTLGTNTGGITGANAGFGPTINDVLSDPSNLVPGSIIYQVVPTSVVGLCVGATTNITVNVIPAPAVTTATSATICSALNPNISLTATLPSTFTWALGTNTGGVTGASAGSGSTIGQTLTNPSNLTPGSIVYIVTPTSIAGSCIGFPTNITVTVNPRPNQPATFVKEFPTAILWDSTCQGQTGVYYSVPSNVDASGYTWSYSGTGVSNIGGSTNTVNANFSTAATNGTLSVTAFNTYGCTSLSARTKAVTVLPYNIWIGYASGDWSDTANWLLPVVPTQTISAQVQSAFYPAIVSSGVQYVNNFIDNLGVVLSINSGSNLRVMGNMTINGTILGPGYLTLAGNTAQTFFGASDNIYNLELNNINGLTVSPSFGNTLYVSNNYLPTAGTLTTNNAFVLYSDAISTGSIGQGPNVGGYISGNVTIQKYIHAGGGQCELVSNCGRAYRFLGHPFSTPIALTQLTDDIDITGSGAPTNGFTWTQTNSPSSFWYDPTSPLANGSVIADPGWTAFTNTDGSGANAWNPYEGIRVFYRGAKGEGLWPQIYIPSAVTINMNGPVNMGDQNIPLVHNSVSSYNFISNPYPANVDMSLVTRGSSIGANFWIWDPNQGTLGAYVSQPFSSSYVLPAYSAFVTTTSAASNNTLLFQESNKVNSPASGNLFKTTSGFGDNTVQLRILSNNDSLSWDRLLLMFDGQAMSQKEEMDAVKFHNAALDFYTFSSDNQALSIDVRPYSDGQVIQLGLKTTVQQTYSIRVDDYNVPTGATLVLHDKYLNKVKTLQKGVRYIFSVTSDSLSQGENRFELNLSGVVNTTTSKTLKVNLSPNPTADNAVLSFETPTAGNTSIRICNLLGQEVYSKDMGNVNIGNTVLPLKTLASGMYLVTVKCGDQTITERLIKE